MDKIRWKDDYSVGHKELDNQHKKLIAIINRLLENPEALISSQTIADVLSELTHYVDKHFEYEERLLADIGYPCYEVHRDQHLQYHEQIAEILMKAAFEKLRGISELLHLLQHWWIDHILLEDMKYKPFLEQ
jgi:hemerythrin